MTTKLETEARTIRVRVIRCNFITRDGISYSGRFEQAQNPEGKIVNTWKGDELWASPKEVAAWTIETTPRRPLVTIIGNRSLKDAEEAVKKEKDDEIITTPREPSVPIM